MLAAVPLLILIAYLCYLLAEAVYGELYRYFPDAFPLFNAVSEREERELLEARLGTVALTAALAIYVYFLLAHDNARDELTISLTDGLFRVHEVILPVTRAFLPADVIASVTVGTLLSLPTAFIPHGFLMGDTLPATLLRPLTCAHTVFGTVGLAFYLVFTLIILHAPALVLALRLYRARWLSGFSLYVGGNG
jgi:hypothetical protein